MATQQDLEEQSFEKIIDPWAEKNLQIEQDWDKSILAAYLLRDYWSVDGGLSLLAGFDYSACIDSAPSAPQWRHTLDPGTLQGHYGQDAVEADELVERMNSDLIQLHVIWAGCIRDTEAEDHPPKFFIEWAISKKLPPVWLAWAIDRQLYAPKPEEPSTPSPDSDKFSTTHVPELAGHAPKLDPPVTGGSATVFREMGDLQASEITLTFVGDKPEFGLGANNMLEISARGERRRVAIAALDLVDKRSGAPNGECGLLLGIAQGMKAQNTSSNAAKMKRLRHVFLHHFGIFKDPFEPYMAATGWVPLFNVTDKRGAADDRAKKEAEERTDSLQRLAEQGVQFANRSDDAADTWMNESGHDY